MREKLIEILGEADDCNAKFCENCEFIDKVEGCVRRQKEILADVLIANGVVISKMETTTFATDDINKKIVASAIMSIISMVVVTVVLLVRYL